MTGVDDFLAHYGKKGMKWGVINDDKGGGSGGSSKKSGGASKKSSGEEFTKAALADFYAKKDPKQMQAEGQKKFKAKADQEFPVSKGAKTSKSAKKDSDEPDPTAEEVKQGRLSDKQKRALKIGAGVAVAGLLIYGAHKSGVEYKARQDSHLAEMDGLFGPGGNRKPNPGSSFYTGLASGKAIDRPEFTIPKSTTFQRLSGHPENGSGYDKGAYATFLTNDKRQYGASHEFGKKSYTVTFNPKEDVKVPSTKTVLSALKKVMLEEGDGTYLHASGERRPIEDKQVFERYHGYSGGDWKQPGQQRLVNELKKRGYSAIVDDMDAGFYGDLPVVFFGEADNVSANKRTNADYSRDMKEKTTVLGRYA